VLVSEIAVRGTFDLSASVEVAAARADLGVCRFLAQQPLSTGAQLLSRILREPLTVPGTFTATPGEATDWADRFGWIVGTVPMLPGQP
jgi:hypothetical protein